MCVWGGGLPPKCYGLGLGTELNMIIGTEWLQMLIFLANDFLNDLKT